MCSSFDFNSSVQTAFYCVVVAIDDDDDDCVLFFCWFLFVKFWSCTKKKMFIVVFFLDMRLRWSVAHMPNKDKKYRGTKSQRILQVCINIISAFFWWCDDVDDDDDHSFYLCRYKCYRNTIFSILRAEQERKQWKSLSWVGAFFLFVIKLRIFCTKKVIFFFYVVDHMRAL